MGLFVWSTSYSRAVEGVTDRGVLPSRRRPVFALSVCCRLYESGSSVDTEVAGGGEGGDEGEANVSPLFGRRS